MILSAYVARRFLRLFLIIAAIFGAILFLIDIVEQIRRFSDENIGLSGAAVLSLLNITASFYSIMPLMTVLHPEKMADIVQTMLTISDEQGRLPVWHLWGNETDCMVGNPGIPVVADAIVKRR